MLQLSRIVRFAINTAGTSTELGTNGYAGSPPIRGLGRHYELRIICAGDADPSTGYLIDIKDIDRAVRGRVIPLIQHACEQYPRTEPAALLPELVAALCADLGPSLLSLRWMLSPYYSVEMTATSPDANPVLLRQKFDFSASHRLHVPGLSDEENRRRFGKCNNPTGHGHNYQFEPCVALSGTGLRPVTAPALPGHQHILESSPFTLEVLERLADESLIRRFDHKNLTTDCPEFRVGPGTTGINATVENIAKVFYDILAAAIQQATPAATLRSMTVWETDRTSATYPG